MLKKTFIIVFIQAAIGYLVLPEMFANEINGQALYKSHCVLCHGEDGTGETDLGSGLGARNFNDKEFQAGIIDGHYVVQTRKGLKKVKVTGIKRRNIGEEIRIEKL